MRYSKHNLEELNASAFEQEDIDQVRDLLFDLWSKNKCGFIHGDQPANEGE